jgi:hypothetical protein
LAGATERLTELLKSPLLPVVNAFGLKSHFSIHHLSRLLNNDFFCNFLQFVALELCNRGNETHIHKKTRKHPNSFLDFNAACAHHFSSLCPPLFHAHCPMQRLLAEE